jgi:RNA polymerase sigma-70 factor (ECF subfamily)
MTIARTVLGIQAKRGRGSRSEARGAGAEGKPPSPKRKTWVFLTQCVLMSVRHEIAWITGTEEETLLTEAELLDIYREHHGPLYAFVSRRVGGDRPLAEDIVQETWLRAVDTWRAGPPENPRAWLMRVARNLLVSHLRRSKPRLVDPDDLALGDDGWVRETPSAASLVIWGLARLRRRQAMLLEAFYIDGMSTRDIALEWGLSERAVEGRLRRARHNLRKRIEPYLQDGRPESDPSESSARDTVQLFEGGKKHA